MSQAMHIGEKGVEVRLIDFSEASLRDIAKEIAEHFRIPSIEEAKEELGYLFEQMDRQSPHKLSDGDKTRFACIALSFVRRRNECHDELGGTTYLYDDGRRVNITSSMSEQQIFRAFKKAQKKK